MDFEKVGNINIVDLDNVNKCGCTCNGGKQHSSNTQRDFDAFGGSRVSADFDNS